MGGLSNSIYFGTGAIRDGRDFCSRNPLKSKANSKIQFARRGPKTARSLNRERVVCKSFRRNWLKHIHESCGAGCRLIPRGKCLREGLCLLSRHSRSCFSRIYLGPNLWGRVRGCRCTRKAVLLPRRPKPPAKCNDEDQAANLLFHWLMGNPFHSSTLPGFHHARVY